MQQQDIFFNWAFDSVDVKVVIGKDGALSLIPGKEQSGSNELLLRRSDRSFLRNLQLHLSLRRSFLILFSIIGLFQTLHTLQINCTKCPPFRLPVYPPHPHTPRQYHLAGRP